MRIGIFWICVLVGITAGSSSWAEGTLLVLDASGSMWGRVDGTPKIALARDAVQAWLEDRPAGDRLGLMAYGHRREGDCGDIELLVEPRPLDREHFTTVLRAVRPKGRTPLGMAVQRAAEALDYRTQRATVVLISDGADNCGADPCAVAKVLERSGADFTVHVIGFDLPDRKAQDQLRCLAEGTGGRFLTVAGASDLTPVLRGLAAAAPPTGPSPSELGPSEGIVEVVSVLTQGGKPLEGSQFRLLREVKDESGRIRRRQVEVVGPVAWARFRVAAGRYVVRVDHDAVAVEETVEVRAGQTQVIPVVLGAGRLVLSLVNSPDGTILERSWFKVYKFAPSHPEGKGRLVASKGYGASVEVVLPSGEYVVEARHRRLEGRARAVVRSGDSTTVRVVAGNGS